jgi:prepilin-type N-terminal cleavage/methylation domain-containing protein
MTMRRMFPYRNGGFTLIEVSVALMMLSMVLVFVYESFVLTMQTKERVETRAERFQAARIAMQRMEREIQSAYIDHQRMETNLGQRVVPPRPVGLQEVKYRTVFVGKTADQEGYPRDRIDFTTFAHYVMAAAGKDDRQSDHEEVAYFTETDYKEDRTDLMHRSDFTLDDDPTGGGDIYPLIEDLRGLNFRYLDPQTKNWAEEWDSREKGGLPAAVEIGLWLENPSDQKKPLYFSKVVRVPLYSPTGVNPVQVMEQGQNSGGAFSKVVKDRGQQIRDLIVPGGGGAQPVDLDGPNSGFTPRRVGRGGR